MPDDTKKLREEIEAILVRVDSLRNQYATEDRYEMRSAIEDEQSRIGKKALRLLDEGRSQILAALAAEALPKAVKLLEIAQGILESEGFETAKKIGDFLAALASQPAPKGATCGEERRTP